MERRIGERPTMTLTVIIPVFNEIMTIEAVLQRVESVSLHLDREIILVDDCSTDGTREVIERLREERGEGLKCLFHERNRGKGAAIRSGFAVATGDILLIQDADLEYDPVEYPKLLAPILAGKADVVYGSRFVGSQPHRVLLFWHSIGNRLLTLLSNMLTNLNLTDMETCFKVFRKEVVSGLSLRENRFGFEPEITAKISKLNCRIYEVGISYSGRTYAEGKKINWKDGLWAIWCILKYNLLT
jgi:glycosyltransferase involved in cell wall biosynthesis